MNTSMMNDSTTAEIQYALNALIGAHTAILSGLEHGDLQDAISNTDIELYYLTVAGNEVEWKYDDGTNQFEGTSESSSWYAGDIIQDIGQDLNEVVWHNITLIHAYLFRNLDTVRQAA